MQIYAVIAQGMQSVSSEKEKRSVTKAIFKCTDFNIYYKYLGDFWV